MLTKLMPLAAIAAVLALGLTTARPVAQVVTAHAAEASAAIIVADNAKGAGDLLIEILAAA